MAESLKNPPYLHVTYMQQTVLVEATNFIYASLLNDTTSSELQKPSISTQLCFVLFSMYMYFFDVLKQ